TPCCKLVNTSVNSNGVGFAPNSAQNFICIETSIVLNFNPSTSSGLAISPSLFVICLQPCSLYTRPCKPFSSKSSNSSFPLSPSITLYTLSLSQQINGQSS